MNLRRRGEWERRSDCINKYKKELHKRCNAHNFSFNFDERKNDARRKQILLLESFFLCSFFVRFLFTLFTLDASVNSFFRVSSRCFKEFFFVLLWNFRAMEKKHRERDSKWHEAMVKKEGKFIFGVKCMMHVWCIILHAKRVDCKTLFFRCNKLWLMQSITENVVLVFFREF